jgi:hypothetical protein
VGVGFGGENEMIRKRPLKTLIANANAAAIKSQNTLDRANALIAQSSDAVSEVEKRTLEVMTALLADANATLQAARDLLQAIQDGVSLTLVRQGDDSIMDFVMGRVDKLPIGIGVDFGGDEESE